MSARGTHGRGRTGGVTLIALLRGAVILVSLGTTSWPASAQPYPDGRPPGTQPARDSPAQSLLHIDATVHKLLIQGVENDGTLWLDLEGRPMRVQLEDIRLAAVDTAPGREARRVLGRFVGRWVRFAFRGVAQDPAGRAHLGEEAAPVQGERSTSTDPIRGRVLTAYASIVDHLLESGLARYCPSSGRISNGLARLEKQARERGRGIWGSPSGAPPSCGEARR